MTVHHRSIPKHTKRLALAAVLLGFLGLIFFSVLITLAKHKEDHFRGDIVSATMYPDDQVIELELSNARHQYIYIHFTENEFAEALIEKYDAQPSEINVYIRREDCLYSQTPREDRQHDTVRIELDGIADFFERFPRSTRAANYDIHFPLNSVIMQDERLSFESDPFVFSGLNGVFIYNYRKVRGRSYTPGP